MSATDPPSMSAWVYDSVVGAYAGEVRLRRLRQRGAVTVEEAVTVTWVPGAHRPRIGLLQRAATPSESLLGALCSCLWPPQAAPVPGGTDGPPAAPAPADRLVDAGVDPTLLSEIRTAVTPGTSALLVLAVHVDLDEIREVIERGRARGDVVLFHTWLAPDAAARIHEARKQLGAR